MSTSCRPVTERHPLRAGLVRPAEAWPWGSLWQRQQESGRDDTLLRAWPVAVPGNWLKVVNQAETDAELEALRRSVQRGQPYGPEAWVKRVAVHLGLMNTLRPRGRPPKHAPAEGSAKKGS